jgi:hypothetical protein
MSLTTFDFILCDDWKPRYHSIKNNQNFPKKLNIKIICYTFGILEKL